MYVPRFNAMDDAEVHRLVAAVGSAELVTVGPEGYPAATLLPVVWEEERLILHMARANPHWKSIEPGAPALAIVTGPQAYVSPAWYPSKDEHGRVVPTWNYTAVHFTGRVEVHEDADWLSRISPGSTSSRGRTAGPSTTPRSGSSSSSCAPSSAWSSPSRRWRARRSSARTGPRRTTPEWSRASAATVAGVS